MDFDSMKYGELQRLAKETGHKANMKADKLREVLKKHYEGAQLDANSNCTTGEVTAAQVDPAECLNVVPVSNNTGLFVTKRRGRPAKRKSLVDTTEECGHNIQLVETESGTGSAKRRRQSVQDSGVSGSHEDAKEPQPVPEEAAPIPEAVLFVHGAATSGKVIVDTSHLGEKKVMKAGKIPRHQALLNRTKLGSKASTPNFKKLHEAHFNKMESIDSYVQRKTKQMEVFTNSVKELKILKDQAKTRPEPANGKGEMKTSGVCASLFSPASVDKPATTKRRHTQLAVSKPVQTKTSSVRASMFSPASVDKKPATIKRKDTQLATSKPALKDSVSFRPTVLSTRRIAVRFSQATLNNENNENRKVIVKTPGRLSAVVRGTPVTGTTPGSTFIFNGNTTNPGTPGTSKTPFDLKASLSRPLNYKPHTGKLKAFAPAQENLVGNQTLPSHQKNFKQHQVQTRDVRRAKHQEDRKQKKENVLGARRGLVMA